ncbi:uncharacterized protein IL334_003788 [Kwoniella shivajii]|uniref:DUF1742-domain-containing protein n=1 Tax=Kwoniella shivajii TaxID=564305 RepID=A0ABZ1CYV9_9TREE|nr:hypothetical protein IL334_003788 [Kwoniella shivajii]
MAATSSNLQNVYYERKTGTPKSCYICRKPTTTVLATLKIEDFLYTCEGHLTDPASPISPPAATSGPSADDIKKVISDYQSREARKFSKIEEKDKDKDQEKKDEKGEIDKIKEKDKDQDKPKSPEASTPSIPTASTPVSPTHRKFALHRHIFEMRKNDIRKREQGIKAKEVSKGLPQVPRTAF